MIISAKGKLEKTDQHFKNASFSLELYCLTNANFFVSSILVYYCTFRRIICGDYQRDI